mmetsp:Transcript_7752/g.12768  ORF Transcript_7752/g.12768 Transcript_7752/m.12768 type:complete len:87 (-) Transcript_7752:54-314(-)
MDFLGGRDGFAVVEKWLLLNKPSLPASSSLLALLRQSYHHSPTANYALFKEVSHSLLAFFLSFFLSAMTLIVPYRRHFLPSLLFAN